MERQTKANGESEKMRGRKTRVREKRRKETSEVAGL